MNNEEKNIVFTADDIEKYFEGRLLPQQMHALEKAALNDPFLADAMEGYESMKGKDWRKHLNVLKEEIEQKGKIAKVIPLHQEKKHWWKAIAAVLIIGVGALTTYILIPKNKELITTNHPVSKTDAFKPDTGREKPATVIASVNPSASNAKEDIAKLIETNPKSTSSENKKKATVIASTKKSTNENSGRPELADSKTVETASVKADETLQPQGIESKRRSNVQSGEQTLENVNPMVDEPNKKESVLNNFFTAQIVGVDNTPLPFSNISVKKDNFGTYADSKGMVRLVSSDSILNVDVKSIGYLPLTFVLKNNLPNTKIVLQEDTKSADANSNFQTRNKKAQETRRVFISADSVNNIQPSDGWDNYNTYLTNNLYLPSELLKNPGQGDVGLSFDVNKNGTITNIKITKSLSRVYDEAAKRLLLEGPQWKTKNGKKASANVIIRF